LVCVLLGEVAFLLQEANNKVIARTDDAFKNLVFMIKFVNC
jgi:hypothetical protein